MEHGDTESLVAQKKQLRKEMLAGLREVPAEERLQSDRQILRRIADMPQFQEAKALFAFVGTGWEVDTWPLIEEALAAGKQVAVPRCMPKGVMEACLIRSRRELRQVPPLGLWEPEEGTPVLAPESVDFALIPCIVCDGSGWRLGKGAGYYDRYLSSGKFTKAAICRQAFLQAALPVEAHDEKVDYVVTEERVIDCRM